MSIMTVTEKAGLVDLRKWFNRGVHIAPLVVFRILFGLIMFISILRFYLKGWIEELYIIPQFHFKYFGFEWVNISDPAILYSVFFILGICSLLISIGLFYRIACTVFFLGFTYVELLDKTTYLNHYYFVSLVSFLLIFIPANRFFSIDVLRNPSEKKESIPFLYIFILMLQMGIVYFFAAIAKLNHEWLFDAMPLKIWLPSKSDIPLFGSLLDQVWIAYVFSWTGLFYDLFIVFLLINSNTRRFGYFLVVVFHLLTWILFPIGMFPFIMIAGTLIFFPASFHQKVLLKLSPIVKLKLSFSDSFKLSNAQSGIKPIFNFLLILFFSVQLILPFRYLFYPGSLFWTEEGYRFSWRVMLMEKSGIAIFHIKDPETGKKWEEVNSKYLTPNQEKMMSTQPDMILEFAHFLKEKYQNAGIKDPEITVESYVNLNGKGSRLFIDSSVNLALEKEGFSHKQWILPR